MLDQSRIHSETLSLKEVCMWWWGDSMKGELAHRKTQFDSFKNFIKYLLYDTLNRSDLYFRSLAEFPNEVYFQVKISLVS